MSAADRFAAAVDRVARATTKATNGYATDGKCHNAQYDTFGHECGKPATWLGTQRDGWAMGFCDQCKATGHERAGMTFAPIGATL